LSAGTGGGAFKASLRTTSTTPTPGVAAPGVAAPVVAAPVVAAPKVVSVKKGKTVTVLSALKTLGNTVVLKSKIVTTVSAASKKICSLSSSGMVKGLKPGKCSLTVKITPPDTKQVKKPKTTTTKISVAIT